MTVETDVTQDTTTEQTEDQPTMLDAVNAELDGEQTEQTEQVEETEEDPEKAAAEAAEKAAADKAKADPTKMPDGLAPEAQKRFQHLVGELKTARLAREQAEAKAKEHEQTVTGLRALMEETKTSAEDFGMLLEYNRLVKSGSLEQALQVLDEQRRMISLAMGKPLPGANALAEYPDLAQAVEAQQLTEAHALELARARMAQRAQQQTQAQTQQQRAAEQQRAAAIETAAKSVDAWATQMASSDIDWPAKEKMLDKHIEWLGQNVDPSKWLASIQHFYSNLEVTAPAATTAAKPRPLASGNGPSGAKPAPKDMAQAIDQALGFA